MATVYTQYVVKDGERWDSVAQKAYGDDKKIEPIIAANPMQALTAILPTGITLRIPIIVDDIDAVDDSLLPPWKRGQVNEGVEVSKVAAPAFLTLSTSAGGSFENDSFD